MTLKSLLTAGMLIAVGMLTGRVLGLLREMLLAARFGVGSQADMAIALLIIPDFLTSALIGSAASAALLPAFASREQNRAIALFWQAFAVSVLVFLIIAVLIASQQGPIMSLINKDSLALPQGSLAFTLTLCSLPLAAATAIISSWLQHRGRFFAPAFATATFNGVILLFIAFLPPGLVVLAAGIIVASLARLAAHAVAFFRSGERLPQYIFSGWQLDARLLKAYGATVGNGIFNLLPQYVPYAAIAVIGSGIAMFNYAFKLVLMPAMLGQTIIQMVLLPWFIKERGQTVPDTAIASYSMALQLAWTVSLALCLALSLASHAIADLCFGHGKMIPSGIDTIAKLFSVGIWALPGMLLTSVWQQILYANEHTRMPLLASMLQAILTIPLCWLGGNMASAPGIVAAFALLQFIPLIPLAKQGIASGIIRHLRLSRIAILMTIGVILPFLLMVGLERLVVPSPATLTDIAIAIVIGIVSLASGLCASPAIRTWGLQWIR